MSARKIIKWVLLGLLIGIFVILFAGAGFFLYLRNEGKKQMHGARIYDAPVMDREAAWDSAANRADGAADSGLGYAGDAGVGVVEYNGERYRYNEDIVTILIMGVDSKEKVPAADSVTDHTAGGQADAIFLLVINPHKERADMIAVNRNAMGEVEVLDKAGNVLGTELMQVCLAHGFGTGREDSCEREVETVSRLMFLLPIHGYIAVQMGAIPVMNDTAGGVTLELLEKIPRGSKTLQSKEGSTVTLKGDDAYHYVQYRDTSAFDSVSRRMERQKQYIKVLLKRIIELTKKDVRFPLSLLGTLNDYVITDLDAPRIAYSVSAYSGYNFDLDNIYTIEGETVDGKDGYEEFIVDDEALYDLVIKLFYEKID